MKFRGLGSLKALQIKSLGTSRGPTQMFHFCHTLAENDLIHDSHQSGKVRTLKTRQRNRVSWYDS